MSIKPNDPQRLSQVQPEKDADYSIHSQIQYIQMQKIMLPCQRGNANDFDPSLETS